MTNIRGTLSNNQRIIGKLTSAYTTSGVTYEGDYEIIPSIEDRTLLTKQKIMTDDLTVKSIPFFDVSNTSGGVTVYIGSEPEIY